MKRCFVRKEEYTVGMAVRTAVEGFFSSPYSIKHACILYAYIYLGYGTALIVDIQFEMCPLDDKKDVDKLFPNQFAPPKMVIRKIKKFRNQVRVFVFDLPSR
jgi:hypothetical protein